MNSWVQTSQPTAPETTGTPSRKTYSTESVSRSGVAKQLATDICSSASTLNPKSSLRRITRNEGESFLRHKEISDGESDTDVRELTVMPCTPAPYIVVS